MTLMIMIVISLDKWQSCVFECEEDNLLGIFSSLFQKTNLKQTWNKFQNFNIFFYSKFYNPTSFLF